MREDVKVSKLPQRIGYRKEEEEKDAEKRDNRRKKSNLRSVDRLGKAGLANTLQGRLDVTYVCTQ